MTPEPGTCDVGWRAIVSFPPLTSRQPFSMSHAEPDLHSFLESTVSAAKASISVILVLVRRAWRIKPAGFGLTSCLAGLRILLAKVGLPEQDRGECELVSIVSPSYSR